MFSLFRKKKPFFTEPERSRIVEAVRTAELQTSGEVRVFVESRCPYMDAIDRAGEIFFRLEMDETAEHNAVLVYVALKDRQLAVFGDQGIHEKVGAAYWDKEVGLMIENFNKESYADGISQCVLEIGQALHQHFPYDKNTDKNELPDDIVFGK
ncbi:MAG TPA: TPM domain-containing protein [Chitinophagaceae bacterium]|nr:TPM domain-containing protein [Chitinophagaceae bacterium]